MAKQAHFKNNKLVFNQDSEISESSGVYKFFNSQNEILYIGKAKNLKKRVKSYLKVRKGEGKRISKLKSNIKYVETIITKTESDALILEQGLISKIRPPFNIQFRDDKSFPAIYFSSNHELSSVSEAIDIRRVGRLTSLSASFISSLFFVIGKVGALKCPVSKFFIFPPA